MGNFAIFKDPLKYFVIYAAKKFFLSFKRFTGRPASCVAFELLKTLIYFALSATELKVKLSKFSWIASTPEWFLHFTVAFRIWWSILPDNGSAFLDSGKFRLATILEKQSFKVFAFFCSSVISLSSSTGIIFSEETVFFSYEYDKRNKKIKILRKIN